MLLGGKEYSMRFWSTELWNRFMRDESGIGVVELILVLVEKPNAKHRYVLCGK